MGLHAALAVHPASGHGTAARIAGSVAARLREAVDRLDLLVADTVEQSRELMRGSHGEGLDLLVVLGGDGAAHQGVQFCASTGVALGLVPSGTGNDLARALNVPADPLDAVDALVAAVEAGRSRSLDLGTADGTWFGTVLCTGFDASVSERVNRMRWPSGPRRYDLAILAELAALRPRRFAVRADDDSVDIDATLLAVGNTAWYGGGIPVCPGAEPDDGMFDVTVVGRLPRHELLRMLPTLRTGAHVDHPAVRTFRAAELHIAGDGDPVYADGEPLGRLPASVRCVPGALSFVG
ncbi:sphingosine kinase [Amycolatopsis antarctica]|uniref:Sphingosine kinase n=1 Tax=Amycolatopsis antarctica TaxID=1854586 RepID=A0A263D3C1_9PSEU|nr:YegS/Rv2252/BmrU family lipid kinase [Amycolatopsis antarctica]OZM72950.1 sphingosine kinase [Amycolatopsis antarctica]